MDPAEEASSSSSFEVVIASDEEDPELDPDARPMARSLYISSSSQDLLRKVEDEPCSEKPSQSPHSLFGRKTSEDQGLPAASSPEIVPIGMRGIAMPPAGASTPALSAETRYYESYSPRMKRVLFSFCFCVLLLILTIAVMGHIPGSAEPAAATAITG